MIQSICSWIMLAFTLIGFFRLVYVDINGAPAKDPAGYDGFITSAISLAIGLSLLYGIGVFDNLLTLFVRS